MTLTVRKVYREGLPALLVDIMDTHPDEWFSLALLGAVLTRIRGEAPSGETLRRAASRLAGQGRVETRLTVEYSHYGRSLVPHPTSEYRRPWGALEEEERQ